MNRTASHRIAQNVKRIRQEKGISQRALAQLLTKAGDTTVRQPQVSDIERSRHPRLTVETLERVAAALGVSISDLLAEECVTA